MSEDLNGEGQAPADETPVAETPAQDTAAPEGEQPGDDAAAAQAEGEGAQPKPKKSPQERINEVTAARREAERERDYWREQALRQAPAATPTTAQPASSDAGRPDPAKYDGGVYDPQYVEDVTDWKASQVVEKRLAERETQTRVQSALSKFEAKVATDYPDGEPDGIAALRAQRSLSLVIQEAILDSDIGPKLADHLGSNARELARISALPPVTQARELAKLELKLAAPPAPNPATNAPPATPQVRGAGGRFAPALRDDMSPEDWRVQFLEQQRSR